MRERTHPVHPGRVLEEEWLKPRGITPHRLATEIGITPPEMHRLIHGKRRITAYKAVKLAEFFGTTGMYWMNLQSEYDLEVEEGFKSRT